MDKNGLSEESATPASDGLRIRLSLKKNTESDSVELRSPRLKNKKKKNVDEKALDEKPSKRPRTSFGKKSGSQTNGDLDSTNDGSDSEESVASTLKSSESSFYSDVLGMEQRVVDGKKRGKMRGSGRGSRGSGGIGSRGGKGSYKKRKND